MTTDPRIEAAAVAIASKVHTRDFDVMATAALAAADNAATITTVEGLDALPVGSVVVSESYQYSLTYPNYPVSFQCLYDGDWYRGGRSSSTHAEYIIPARVIHWGTE